jgi:hypothetical protein
MFIAFYDDQLSNGINLYQFSGLRAQECGVLPNRGGMIENLAAIIE